MRVSWDLLGGLMRDVVAFEMGREGQIGFRQQRFVGRHARRKEQEVQTLEAGRAGANPGQ